MSYTPGSLNGVHKKIKDALEPVLASTRCKKVTGHIKGAALVKPQIQKIVLAGIIENLVEVPETGSDS
jgi:hypothetical protein